jgi:hypothetical protein
MNSDRQEKIFYATFFPLSLSATPFLPSQPLLFPPFLNSSKFVNGRLRRQTDSPFGPKRKRAIC